MSYPTKYYRDKEGDYLMVFGYGSEYHLRECRATAIEGLPSSMCTCQASLEFLAGCTYVKKAQIPSDWARYF